MLRSTFSGFTTAQMAMSASQRALDVTGQNLSNVNTSGYTRQRLDLASISPVGASYTSSPSDCKVGQGVLMTGISQIRNPFLDLQYRNQLSRVGTTDAKDQILTKLGNIFDETDKDAVRTAMSDVITQLNNLARTEAAGSNGADALVRSAMEVLLNAVHEKSGALKEVQDDLVTKLDKTLVPDINNMLQSIVELNKSIKSSQILGNPALELQDQRNTLIDQLAEYLPIDVKYVDQNVGAGVIVDALEINFKDKNGVSHSLISDNEAATFNFSTTAGGVPVSLTITDATDPTRTIDVTDALKEGVLKGNIDMLNKAGLFDGTDVKGISYYEKMFNTFVDEFATRLNAMNADASGNHDLFAKVDPNKPFAADNIKISDEWMNGDVKITLGTQTGSAGSTAYDNVLKMINLISTDKLPFNTMINGVSTKIFTGTFFECFDSIQNTQAIEKNASTSILKNHVSVLNQIADTKDSVSGVYLDEEVMNLMKYQQSYNAAARLMTTLDEALDTLINNTGVVGR